MSWRYRKTFKLLSWLRLNISKTRASLSIGPRWIGLTVGLTDNKQEVHASLPGTGLSYRARMPSIAHKISAGAFAMQAAEAEKMRSSAETQAMLDGWTLIHGDTLIKIPGTNVFRSGRK